MKPDLKKLIVLNIPYVIVWYLVDKLCWLYRMAEGTLAGEKLLYVFLNFQSAFAIQVWHFSLRQSVYCKLSLSRSALVSVFGVSSTSWRGMATITPVPMLMYGKEASNRKQEIDRQHYTIPNQRPKDKHCGKS